MKRFPLVFLAALVLSGCLCSGLNTEPKDEIVFQDKVRRTYIMDREDVKTPIEITPQALRFYWSGIATLLTDNLHFFNSSKVPIRFYVSGETLIRIRLFLYPRSKDPSRKESNVRIRKKTFQEFRMEKKE